MLKRTTNIFKGLIKIISLSVVILGVQLPGSADAQTHDGTPASVPAKDETGDDGEISTILTPANKNAFFDNKAQYTFEVKNTTPNDQIGKVSYRVTTETGKFLREDSIKVRIGKKSAEKYNFEIPANGVGFYKLSFIINVSDYDDTIKKVFGIRPEQIVSQYQKPADFEVFWQTVKDELAKVPPKFKVVGIPKMDEDNRRVYAIEMQSLGNMMIRGWMTMPKTHNKNRKFSVLLGLPGYQVALNPLMGLDDDLVIITLNVRGQGNSRGPVDTRRDEFIFYHIEDKNKYVMRGVIADCLRAVDFICAQPDLRHDQILVSGGSMGGFLAVATASLDKRVRLCSAQNPILCDIRNLVGEVKWPISDITKYVATQPGLTMNKVLDNLDYFDVKNFATNLTCPTIMGIGLLDPFAPPNNEYAAYNNIKPSKRIMVFKDLGHEISIAYKELEGRWMRDTFALF
ncbi:acetylxylan esterase [Mucilaginibacter sp. UR6-11]|uniref:acetylxylan esterase n=1 Tax=Mucilaginibacter sp. UR6-11 TaxID=1435644 RepID=UPI001E5E07E7|nr:acetylxylan esterase [Mucilaginibacter sp. UR6-11]MCC8427162.1 acetylxylan esterase [Mucilaginibacter sp. UR6-11]